MPKHVIDTSLLSGFTPPSGSWQQPSNFMNSAGGMGVSQTIYWMPFDIGPNSMTLQSIAVNVNTALVGGTTTTTLALYSDDGTGGFPLLTSGGLLQSGTVVLTSVGKATLSSSLVLTRGRYWGAFLYNETSAPSTAAILATYSNAAPALWLPNGFTLGSASRALTLTGQTSMPTTAQTLSVSNTGQVVPVMGLRRA